MIEIRRARSGDAPGIGAVHVSAWRSAYAGILPDAYLARLSVARQAHYYERSIRLGGGVLVAAARQGVVGFATARAVRPSELGDGEVETLYVLDDFRDAGVGSALLRAAGQFLAGRACNAAYLWVLRDNPAQFFYERLGGKLAASGTTIVGGKPIPQLAYAWNPIAKLIEQEVSRQ